MSRWFRVYDDLVDDPKVQRLSDVLFRAVINLWCLTSRNGGVLPRPGDMAFALRMKPEKLKLVLAELRIIGLIVDDETGTHPHNWQGRQFKSDVSNERVQRHRERQRNVTLAVTETPPDTDSTETERKKDSEASASAQSPPDPSIAERELFDRGKFVLGQNAGGMIANLKRSKGGNVSLARAVIEQASTAQNPREYVAGAIQGKSNGKDNSSVAVARRLAAEFREQELLAHGGGGEGGYPPRLLPPR